jgi:quinol-cytochrome oxidoreductase complex cytochrome b subunit
VVLASSFTGYLLPRDQLALWAVTVGTDLRGYTVLWHSEVRFVLIGGKEIGTSTLLRWVFIHLVLGASGLMLAGVAGRRLRTSTSAGV